LSTRSPRSGWTPGAPHLGHLDRTRQRPSVWPGHLAAGLPTSVTRIAAERRCGGPSSRVGVVGGTRLSAGWAWAWLGALQAGGRVIGLGQQFAVDLGGGPRGYGVVFASASSAWPAGMWTRATDAGRAVPAWLFGRSMTESGSGWLLLSLVPNIVVRDRADHRAGCLRRGAGSAATRCSPGGRRRGPAAPQLRAVAECASC